MTMHDKHALRRRLRARRNRLSPRQQRLASRRAARHLERLLPFARARRIAAYVARNGELDPQPALRRAERAGKACYLPVLAPFGHNRLWFRRWRPGQRMPANRYGIPEPTRAAARLPSTRLDVVLVPLVGFDLQGTRLGMGGGYYDRTFAFKLRHPRTRPLLIGYAHHCQLAERLPRTDHDVALTWIVTDRGVHRVTTRKD